MRRWAWFTLGWVAVVVGSVGVVLPVVPTTGPFVLAAACFARSSPRFERWVLGLPRIGPLVRDHRDGLGMPRRAKVIAIGAMLLACTLSALTVGSPAIAAVVVAAGLIGTWYVGWRVPTRYLDAPRDVLLTDGLAGNGGLEGRGYAARRGDRAGRETPIE
jgi:uncharacterized membrane protein YbaN (DUF454 family)